VGGEEFVAEAPGLEEGCDELDVELVVVGVGEAVEEELEAVELAEVVDEVD
jgi:hypothetical protein